MYSFSIKIEKDLFSWFPWFLPWFGSWGTCVSLCWPQPELCGVPPPYTDKVAQGHLDLSYQSGYFHAASRDIGERRQEWDRGRRRNRTGSSRRKIWWNNLCLRVRNDSLYDVFWWEKPDTAFTFSCDMSISGMFLSVLLTPRQTMPRARPAASE